MILKVKVLSGFISFILILGIRIFCVNCHTNKINDAGDSVYNEPLQGQSIIETSTSGKINSLFIKLNQSKNLLRRLPLPLTNKNKNYNNYEISESDLYKKNNLSDNNINTRYYQNLKKIRDPLSALENERKLSELRLKRTNKMITTAKTIESKDKLAELKILLRKSDGFSLIEILQRMQLSLDDLLKGRGSAISAIKNVSLDKDEKILNITEKDNNFMDSLPSELPYKILFKLNSTEIPKTKVLSSEKIKSNSDNLMNYKHLIQQNTNSTTELNIIDGYKQNKFLPWINKESNIKINKLPNLGTSKDKYQSLEIHENNMTNNNQLQNVQQKKIFKTRNITEIVNYFKGKNETTVPNNYQNLNEYPLILNNTNLMTTMDITIEQESHNSSELLQILSDHKISNKLLKILQERNMTLKELIEQRERGSSQLHLAEISNNNNNNYFDVNFMKMLTVIPITKSPLLTQTETKENNFDIITTFENFPKFNLPNLKNINSDNIEIDFDKTSNEFYTNDINIHKSKNIGQLLSDSQKQISVLSLDSEKLNSSMPITDLNKTFDIIHAGSNNHITKKLPEISKYEDHTSKIIPELLKPDENNKIEMKSNYLISHDILDLELSGHGLKRNSINIETTIIPFEIRSVLFASLTIIGVSCFLFLFIFFACKWRQQNNKKLRYEENFYNNKIRLPGISRSSILGQDYISSPMDPNSTEVQEYFLNAMKKPF